MKLNKIEGIQFLENFKIPTIKFIDINSIVKGETPIDNGLSVRVSPLDRNSETSVYLPSIHNCTDRNEIKNFVDKHKDKYKIFIHETVNPDVIGAVSKLDFRESIVIEIYRDFMQREKGQVSNRVMIPLYGDKMMISKMEMDKKDREDYENFRKVIYYLKDMPFSNYDIEFVIQNGEVIFTDLTLPSNSEYSYLKDYLDGRSKERE